MFIIKVRVLNILSNFPQSIFLQNLYSCPLLSSSLKNPCGVFVHLGHKYLNFNTSRLKFHVKYTLIAVNIKHSSFKFKFVHIHKNVIIQLYLPCLKHTTHAESCKLKLRYGETINNSYFCHITYLWSHDRSTLTVFKSILFYEGVSVPNIPQSSQPTIAALPQHLDPIRIANPLAVLLSPPVRKTRVQQPPQEEGRVRHYVQGCC